jgi:hypothetical protein
MLDLYDDLYLIIFGLVAKDKMMGLSNIAQTCNVLGHTVNRLSSHICDKLQIEYIVNIGPNGYFNTVDTNTGTVTCWGKKNVLPNGTLHGVFRRETSHKLYIVFNTNEIYIYNCGKVVHSYTESLCRISEIFQNDEIYAVVDICNLIYSKAAKPRDDIKWTNIHVRIDKLGNKLAVFIKLDYGVTGVTLIVNGNPISAHNSLTKIFTSHMDFTVKMWHDFLIRCKYGIYAQIQ